MSSLAHRRGLPAFRAKVRVMAKDGERQIVHWSASRRWVAATALNLIGLAPMGCGDSGQRTPGASSASSGASQASGDSTEGTGAILGTGGVASTAGSVVSSSSSGAGLAGSASVSIGAGGFAGTTSGGAPVATGPHQSPTTLPFGVSRRTTSGSAIEMETSRILTGPRGRCRQLASLGML